jgi:hypothetical protein
MFAQSFVFLAVLVAAVLSAVSASSGYMDSCNVCALMQDTRLQVRCRNRGGIMVESELDLNGCFAGNTGTLTSAVGTS